MNSKVHVVADNGVHSVHAEINGAPQDAAHLVAKHIESIIRHKQFGTELKLWVESEHGETPATAGH
jgi:hypothetical protein